ncbi:MULTISPECIES: hypothetical protein [unclassified Paenibacillus]|uniref:hypothetical protein n=1 Tax=unclassified Paenibacillus TaxID=185978 RepID=UPI001C0F9D1D|nr:MULTISPECIES: hypothetical protein [unclassified Paenibacillus]MBU5441792.1 hypothetical protein [Paenibacillus sp. MSJ-34]CAH0119837.1 hypothetical protein PAE9249_02345 [Paenibacillus sp. CECT 9249]
MSLKAVEMQIAIPRTNDAGIMQAQSQHKAVADQAQLAGQAEKTTEEMRQKNAKVDETAHLPIRDGERRQNAYYRRTKRKQEDDGGGQQDEPKHPYKGHHIDLSL